jgi:hypothetical protein
MYIRFVIGVVDPDSGAETGIFQTLTELLDHEDIPAHTRDELHGVRDWFRRNLKAPRRLNRSRRPHRIPKAICWFKPTAIEHIEKARSIVQALQELGVDVRMLKTNNLGYIVYQDEFQIAAEPFADTV